MADRRGPRLRKALEANPRHVKAYEVWGLAEINQFCHDYPLSGETGGLYRAEEALEKGRRVNARHPEILDVEIAIPLALEPLLDAAKSGKL